jgi:hypothetical protein
MLTVIEEFLDELPIEKEKILGVGINLSGRINQASGYSYSFFHFMKNHWRKPSKTVLALKPFWRMTPGPWPLVNFVAAP